MDQTGLKNRITKIKNTLEGINGRIDDTEEWIIELEGKVVEITQTEQKNENNLKDLQDDNKHTNIGIIGVPEGEEKEANNLFEDMIAENFSNLGKETHIQVQEAQRVPTKMNLKRPTPRHIIIKMAKIKDKERI